eukprot:scaffold86280_cov17-Tisochrysis_lutea.AAC.1
MRHLVDMTSGRVRTTCLAHMPEPHERAQEPNKHIHMCAHQKSAHTDCVGSHLAPCVGKAKHAFLRHLAGARQRVILPPCKPSSEPTSGFGCKQAYKLEPTFGIWLCLASAPRIVPAAAVPCPPPVANLSADRVQYQLADSGLLRMC